MALHHVDTMNSHGALREEKLNSLDDQISMNSHETPKFETLTGRGVGNNSAEEDKSTATLNRESSTSFWGRIESVRKSGKVFIDGSTLDMASVIAVGKYDCDAYIDMTRDLCDVMHSSVEMLEQHLSKGYSVYGVNTGFGGSADTRTTDLAMLQSALLQLTQAGILAEADMDQSTNFVSGTESHSMPVPWVRATMLIRANNAIRGHSGVRLEIVEGIMHLLRNRITPIIPVRGSISASGDLMPLSYIAGVLEGNPDIFVRVQQDQSRIMSAPEALRFCGLQAYVLGPKEGLGLINGTAASAAVACFGMHESTKLISLAQMLVAMSCEALLGNTESYHPFIHSVRPHRGQIECAGNILRFLKGSKLAVSLADQDRFKPGLFQDRYALRGTPQWLGPQLEDFDSAISQLTTELNSTSDNPLIDAQTGGVYSGANFIASSVASGMEKSRLSLQIIGRLLFSLSSEMINPALSRGLPPNLAADDPSLSFTMKGIDISMAAYMSELAFLANPVTSHVQSAESHNQQINSLALISARYTVQAGDILSQMCAAHLYVVCQALDLRVLYVTFLENLQSSIGNFTKLLIPEFDSAAHTELDQAVFEALSSAWNATTSLDLGDRCRKVAAASLPNVINCLHKHNVASSTDTLAKFALQIAELVQSSFAKKRQEFFVKQTTPLYLGGAAKSLYLFVRQELNVPFHKGLVEHPTVCLSSHINVGMRKTIGSQVSIIHAAIAKDRIWIPMAEHFP